MYAVVETGGKQVRVQEGDVIQVERLSGEAGEAVDLEDVRLIVDGENVVADPVALQGAKVRAVIRGHGRGKKVVVFRFKRRKNIRRKRGHRQEFTEIEVAQVIPAAGGD